MIARYAKKEDFQKFEDIKNEFLNDYGIKPQSSEFISKEFNKFLKKCIILLEDNNIIIGYMFGSIEQDDYETYGYVWEIFVSRKHRGKGYSTIIKDKFLEFLKEHNITMCRLDVSPKKEAITVYEKWGFKVDKYRMTLKL